MKNENLYWAKKECRDELLKLVLSIKQKVPMGYNLSFYRRAQRISIPGGLCSHYFMSAA